MTQEALKLALEALEGFYEYGYDRQECFEHITAIKEALLEHAMRETQRLGQEIEPKIGCVNHDCDQCKAQPERHELQAKGEHPAPCARHCEANAFQIVIKNLKAQLAQPEQEPVAHCEAGPNYCWKCLEESNPTYGSEEIKKLREVNKSLMKNIEELKKEPPPFWPVVQHLLDEYGLQFIDIVAAYRESTQPEQEPVALQKSGIANSPSDPEICNERSAQACGPVYCGDSGGYCNKCPKQKIIQAVKPCKGMNCGCTDGRSHSLECLAELAAAIEGGHDAPPQRKPLTDKAITQVIDSMPRGIRGWMSDWDLYEFARAIEAAHGIKENT